MKLVSVNAIILGAVNISLFAKIYCVEGLPPPLTLFILSFIYIDLILLLQFQHRRFQKFEVNIQETACLIRKYFYLFAVGSVLTLLHKLELQQNNEYLLKYVLLGRNVYYSFLYYNINLFLGYSYLYLFKKDYEKSNRQKIPSQIIRMASGEQFCTICQFRVKSGQSKARIGCMHTFHSQCLHKWVKHKSTCPTCKSVINQY